MKYRSSSQQAPQGKRFCAGWLAIVFATLSALAIAFSSSATAATTKGGTLTIADGTAPSSLNVATDDPVNSAYYDLAYEPLIIQESNGGYGPGLATAWKIGADNKSMTFTLRKGVRFSDGTKLTARAMKTWLNHELKTPGSYAAQEIGTLKSVTIHNSLSLTLHFSASTPNLEADFSQTYEDGELGSPKAVGPNYLANRTDGAGEYKLDPSATVPGSRYTYIPNPHYYDRSAVHWKKIVITVITSGSTTLAALKTGSVQFAIDQGSQDIETAKKSGLDVAAVPQAVYSLGLLDRAGKIVPALGNLDVRKAINYAINRPEITQALFPDAGIPTDQTTVPGDDSYNKALNSVYSYNVAKAKQLMAQAGYSHGFTMQVVDETDAFGTLEQALAGELSQIGITIQPIEETEFGAYVGALASGQYPAAMIGFGGQPASVMYNVLWGPMGTFNAFKTDSSTLDALDQLYQTASPAEAPKIAQQMSKYIVDQAWFAPVLETPIAGFWKKSIAGVLVTTERALWYLPEVKPA